MPRKVSESVDVAFFAEGPDGPGLYVVEGDNTEDENGVRHNTGAEPGRRVYPHPDGEGWTYEATELGSDGVVRVVGEVSDEEEEGDN